MKTAVQRWGNSLALRIPLAYAAETRLSAGSEVDLTVKSGTLMVRPVVQARPLLAELLKQVTPSNRHQAISTGEAMGREVW